MGSELLELLISLVAPLITKHDTNFRKDMPPRK